MATSEWSRDEDAKPGAQLLRIQPEITSRGKVWTQRIFVNWPSEGHTQLIIRECSGDILVDHGRIYPIRQEDDSA